MFSLKKKNYRLIAPISNFSIYNKEHPLKPNLQILRFFPRVTQFFIQFKKETRIKMINEREFYDGFNFWNEEIK